MTEWSDGAQEAVVRVTNEWGGDIHGWRCDYPDLYGPCCHAEMFAADILTALAPYVTALEAAAERWGRVAGLRDGNAYDEPPF